MIHGLSDVYSCDAMYRKVASTRRTYVAVGLATSKTDAARLTARNVLFTIMYYIRATTLLSRRLRSRLQRAIEVRGLRNFETAAANGQGVVLATVHLGDFDLAASWLAQVHNTRMILPVAIVPPGLRRYFYNNVRAACGLELRFGLDASVRRLRRELTGRSAVVIPLDRTPSKGGVRTSLFGRDVLVPHAAAVLAQKSGAYMVPVATWSCGKRRILEFGTPLHVARGADGGDHVHAATEGALTWLAAAVAAAPNEWHIPSDPALASGCRGTTQRIETQRVGRCLETSQTPAALGSMD